MASAGCPSLDEKGEMTGIISLDDILVDLGQELSDVALAIRTEFRTEISKADREHRD